MYLQRVKFVNYILQSCYLSICTDELFEKLFQTLMKRRDIFSQLSQLFQLFSKEWKIFPFRNVEDYAREHEEASRNIQQYLSNPINAYLLVKRLTTDWKKVEELITEDVGKSFVANITNSRSDLKFPTDEDLNGAAVALMRLQDTYKLETAQVAKGVLNGVQYSTGLTGMYNICILYRRLNSKLIHVTGDNFIQKIFPSINFPNKRE